MKIIFSDFDGTLTNNGKLGAIFFEICELIKSNKAELVIVSGRSLSWGHFLLTHFDFDYAIMEGGGVIVYKDDDGNIAEKDLITDSEINTLEDFTIKLQEEVPSVIISKDSFGRRTDRAIEFSQMNSTEVNKCVEFMRKNKINFSKSNVHINYWVGDISKAKGVREFMQNFAKDIAVDEVCFFGDAMNDESMFELFPHTIGVSNISEVINDLTFKPKVVLEGDENVGALGVLNYLKKDIYNN